MEMIRSFIAVEIDQSNKQELSTLISHLKKSDADVKWANENQMHLTLKFLGTVDETKLQKISDILKRIANDFSAFNIQFSKIGAFPNINRPRVIWMGISKGSNHLKLLNNKIESEFEKIGFGKEKREYNAHLTFGRVKSSKNIPGLKKIIDETTIQFHDEIRIDKIILFQSTLRPKGAIYTPLVEHTFLKTPDTQHGELN